MRGIREWLAGGTSAKMLASLRQHQANCTSQNSPHTFLGNHDFARLADVVDASLLPAAFCLLLTLPGVPGIYYGDELAVTATGTEDIGLRPPLSPHALSSLTDKAVELLESVRRLGRWRRENSWLVSAALEGISVKAGALTYVVAGPDSSIRVYVNPTTQSVQFSRDRQRSQPVLGTTSEHRDHVDISPHSWAIHRSVPIESPA
jgi:hypothetical protein